ncbi:MAG: SMP-30/gluconolactonase/LRE family protein [Bacteroidales bacterium]|nr:SMP-30/gluconolactonase/LRE family protein [Bacteroidales bacterium]MCF8333482.1 SMP-30/gluconolactonase/LRE family protein [Bacteroidales bacterium]
MKYFFITVFLGVFLMSSQSQNPQAELVLDSQATLGEGAIWNHKTETLLWVDIEEGILNEFDPETAENRSFDMNQRIGTVVPVDKGGVLVALEDGVYAFDLMEEKLEKVAHPEEGTENIRYNDGKCDPAGCFWIGSMGLDQKEGRAALYRIDGDFSWKRMIDDVTISNGIVWSPDKTRMYYIDTPTRKVMAYDYDNETGKVSNPEVAVTIPDSLGYPDGSTMDSEGMLWIAMWDGQGVTRWNPETGKLLERITIPALNVTSCAFGGKNLETLFITSAKAGMNEKQLKRFPESGGVFKVKPGVKGMKANFFRTKKTGEN